MKLDKKKNSLFFCYGISFILSYDSLLMCMTEHIASSPGREIPINVKSMHCGTCHSCVLSADDKVFASAIVTDKLRITRCCRHVYWICHGCFIVNIILCRKDLFTIHSFTGNTGRYQPVCNCVHQTRDQLCFCKYQRYAPVVHKLCRFIIVMILI